ncbi:phage major capsid protein, HK97 family [Geodermatophilus amargosae]|uniref:Phage major capsid protein, HK97 family n=1 Tax=Geodermatophilus amargosae TaxID=1296565 RepID=A0A1I7CZ29_9ACTN|nr:phage major capsid protein [Geodermatophilus amargosae]SFU04659.1 phage major capsid protein, HK97 family [Geodermatophilus amargosae]
MPMSRAERDKRLGEIWHDLDRLGRFDTLTAEQERRSKALYAERETLTREAIMDTATSGRGTVLSGSDDYGLGDGDHAAARTAPSVRSEVRGRALDAIERADLLPDHVREHVTRSVEGDDDPTAGLARATVVLADPAYRSAFLAWLRDPVTGPAEWSPEEREAARRVSTVSRTMSLGVPGAGGYLVPFELDPQLRLVGPGSVDPMRRVARVVQTAANEKRFVTTAGVTASWDAELAEVSDDTPALLNPAITTHKGASFVPVSIELFEDADLAPQVAALFADAKAQLESVAFTTGSGAGQPKGVITAVSAVGGSVIATATNALAVADVYAAQNALPARWRQGARFMANLSVINGYRALIKGPGMTESFVDDSGSQPRMAGWVVEENSAMDGSLTASTADYALLAGSFDQYVIVDRIGTTLELVPHLFGAAGRPTGSRGFYMHWRTGGDVLTADAFRLVNYSG